MALVIVSGAIANKPFNGGEAWVRLNWALGIQRLGHVVLFVEQIEPSAPGAGNGSGRSPSIASQIRYFEEVMVRSGLQRQAALIDPRGRRLWGLTEIELAEAISQADALVNISGHLQCTSIRDRVAKRAYVDLDPGLTQFWRAQGIADIGLDGHDFYFSVGENIGAADCPIPTNDLPWRPIRQPAVLDQFPIVHSPAPWRFTTIGSWRGSYGPVQAGAKVYGQKVHEFRKFIELPQLVEQSFEVALDIHPAEEKDLALLRRNGWRLVDPIDRAGDPWRFRRYIQESGAEFSVAQGMYVDTNSGWFSDRTVRYLASGKPAVVQDTGFSRNLPAGEGLVAFRTIEEAAAGVAAVARDYERHCRAARRIAEQCFDSDRILGGLMEDMGVGMPRQRAAARGMVGS